VLVVDAADDENDVSLEAFDNLFELDCGVTAALTPGILSFEPDEIPIPLLPADGSFEDEKLNVDAGVDGGFTFGGGIEECGNWEEVEDVETFVGGIEYLLGVTSFEDLIDANEDAEENVEHVGASCCGARRGVEILVPVTTPVFGGIANFDRLLFSAKEELQPCDSFDSRGGNCNDFCCCLKCERE
jgi:hypothetical protein